MAVLELRGPLPPAQLGLLSDEVRAGALDVARTKGFIVMSRENIAIILKDMGKDCAEAQGECEVETGRNLGAAYVLSGEVVQMGEGFICTLKVFDTSSGALLASDRARGSTADGLLDGLRPLSEKMMQQSMQAQRRVGVGLAPVVAATATETGEAVVEVGENADFAALAAKAAQAKAIREQREAELAAEAARLEAERRAEEARLEAQRRADAEALAREKARLAAEEAKAKAALLAAQRARIAEARDAMLAQAKGDLASIQPLLEMAVTEETLPVLQAYVNKYSGAKVRVDDVVEHVAVPGVDDVRRHMAGRKFTVKKTPPPQKKKKRDWTAKNSPTYTPLLDSWTPPQSIIDVGAMRVSHDGYDPDGQYVDSFVVEESFLRVRTRVQVRLKGPFWVLADVQIRPTTARPVVVTGDLKMSGVTALAGVALELFSNENWGAQLHGGIGVVTTKLEGIVPADQQIDADASGGLTAAALGADGRYAKVLGEVGAVARYSPINHIHFWLEGAYQDANDLIPDNRDSTLIRQRGLRLGAGLGFYF